MPISNDLLKTRIHPGKIQPQIYRINSAVGRVRQITCRRIREINLNPSAGAHSDPGSESYHIHCSGMTRAQIRNVNMARLFRPRNWPVRHGQTRECAQGRSQDAGQSSPPIGRDRISGPRRGAGA